jgi:hypothetical protein
VYSLSLSLSLPLRLSLSLSPHVRAFPRQVRTPEPEVGREHREIQTELYLEEIVSRPLEVDASAQTDQFIDRPPTPVYIPRKRGIDAETQVYDGDLFDFDHEVAGMLDVIVGKTLEEALCEVLEEEELAGMARARAEFHRRRDAALAETQRLEAAEARRFAEKQRRVQQERERAAAERIAREKVAARAYAATYLSDLVGGVFGDLTNRGFFFDTVERDVETGFLPYISARVDADLERLRVARRVTDEIIRGALRVRRDGVSEWAEWEERERETRDREERERQERERQEREAREAAEREREEEEYGEGEEFDEDDAYSEVSGRSRARGGKY